MTLFLSYGTGEIEEMLAAVAGKGTTTLVISPSGTTEILVEPRVHHHERNDVISPGHQLNRRRNGDRRPDVHWWHLGTRHHSTVNTGQGET